MKGKLNCELTGAEPYKITMDYDICLPGPYGWVQLFCADIKSGRSPVVGLMANLRELRGSVGIRREGGRVGWMG